MVRHRLFYQVRTTILSCQSYSLLDANDVELELEHTCLELEESLGLREGLMGEPWGKMSGGERQRAAIACALLLVRTTPRRVLSCLPPTAVDTTATNAPGGNGRNLLASENSEEERWKSVREAVLLLDEPTAACDVETTLRVEEALKRSGAAIIMVTHDDRQALRMPHRRILLTSSPSSLSLSAPPSECV